MNPVVYLTTPEVSWLGKLDMPPLFIQHHRLADRRTLPRAAGQYGVDSGGFSQLQMYGEWRTTPQEYVAAVRRYDQEIGHLDWAASQDWMVEKEIIQGGWHHGQYYAGTHLSVAEHQVRTVENLVLLQELWGDADTSPFMPTLQGATRDDYLHCMDLYHESGVDLTLFPLVGLGSVCRRQATSEIGDIIAAIRAADPAIPLHGFGVKTLGLARYGHELESCDSAAWSKVARWAPGRLCQSGTHLKCANCLDWALEWHGRVVGKVGGAPQLDLFVPPETADATAA